MLGTGVKENLPKEHTQKKTAIFNPSLLYTKQKSIYTSVTFYHPGRVAFWILNIIGKTIQLCNVIKQAFHNVPEQTNVIT